MERLLENGWSSGNGKGCAAFVFTFSLSAFTSQKAINFICRNDAVIDDVLLVSRDYELYLMGLELDYRYDDFESMFKFNNPKAKSTCGCGTSFSIGV